MRTIKSKTMMGIFIITVVLGILLNIIFRQAVQENFYRFIEKDFKNIKLILRGQVNNEIVLNDIEVKEKGMEAKGQSLVNNLSRKLDCFVALCDEDGNLINDSMDQLIDIKKQRWFSQELRDKISVHIEDTYKNVVGVLKYPYYYEGKYLGTLVLQKDYSEIYSSNRGLKYIFTLAEFTMLSIFLFVINIFLKSITKPLKELAKEIKRVEKGDYRDLNIKCGKDELGIVVKNFNSMTKEIKEKINTINEEKEKIQVLSNTQKKFFDNVTHELKTPLTAISGYAQLLQSKFNNEEFRIRAISRIHMESDRLHKLVCEVLTISRNRNNLNRKKETLNVIEILKEVIGDIEVIYKDVSIEFKKEGLDKVNIEGVYDELYEVFLNLLDNGAKYSFDKRVFVLCQVREKEIKIKIKNRCGDIPLEIKHELLQPFVKHSYDRNIDSTGLGLYIAKELIESNDGNLDYHIKDRWIEFNIGICFYR